MTTRPKDTKRVEVRRNHEIWVWACPCCWDYAGFFTYGLALWGAHAHIRERHPRGDI